MLEAPCSNFSLWTWILVLQVLACSITSSDRSGGYGYCQSLLRIGQGLSLRCGQIVWNSEFAWKWEPMMGAKPWWRTESFFLFGVGSCWNKIFPWFITICLKKNNHMLKSRTWCDGALWYVSMPGKVSGACSPRRNRVLPVSLETKIPNFHVFVFHVCFILSLLEKVHSSGIF